MYLHPESDDVHKYGVIVPSKTTKKNEITGIVKRGANIISSNTIEIPSRSDLCPYCKELSRIGELPVEIFRYKVVYPGGVFVRVSPSLDAKKTGVILEFGTVFEATKSLVSDGINYAKLSDNSGWVFGNKGGTEVLELLEVIRVPRSLLRNGSTKCAQCSKKESAKVDTNSKPGNGHSSSSSNSQSRSKLGEVTEAGDDQDNSDQQLGATFHRLSLTRAHQERNKLFQVVRVENRFWRDIRGRCTECTTFDQFVRMACSLDAHPPSIPEPGPARSAWMAESSHDQQIRSCISLIASITRQCADIADSTGLESSLWVLAHLGPKVPHAMGLVVEAANDRFESLSSGRQSELLYIVLEVGSRTKAQSIELSKLVDILPDDVRNFLQRWIIIKVC